MASPESQDFVQKCMSRIEREFGIKQARVFGNALRLKRYLNEKGAVAFGICPQYLPPDDDPHVTYQQLYRKVRQKVPDLLVKASLQAALPSTSEIRGGPKH
jgi:hypothetical protein